MKKHMLKETNDMRRLMGLDLLNEEMESAGKEDKEKSGDLDEGVVGVDAPESKDELEKDEKDHGDVVNEDSEGEETYNYGEDEGADHKEEEHLEDEEKMAPHDRIKAIEDHLEALKKDMGYDEDHEDRDEEGTHFAEGKKYSGVLNTLTESEYKRLKKFINEGEATPNVDLDSTTITIKDGEGTVLYEGPGINAKTKPARFKANEIMTITIPGLDCEGAMIVGTIGDKSRKIPVECKSSNPESTEKDVIEIDVSKFGTEYLMGEKVFIKGNVDGGEEELMINMNKSSVKQKPKPDVPLNSDTDKWTN